MSICFLIKGYYRTKKCNVFVADDTEEDRLDVSVRPVNRNGKIVYMDEDLVRKLDEEHSTWHWTPWLRTRLEISDGVAREMQCFARDSIDSFPDGLFDGNVTNYLHYISQINYLHCLLWFLRYDLIDNVIGFFVVRMLIRMRLIENYFKTETSVQCELEIKWND